MAFRLDTRSHYSERTNSDYRRPLGLDSWKSVFDPSTGVLLGEADIAVIPLSDRVGARELAVRAGERSVASIRDDRVRTIAGYALTATITDQAARNDRYNQPGAHARLAAKFSPERHRELTYGTAPIEDLASVVRDKDIPIVSLEFTRHSHGNNWQYGDNINHDTRRELFGYGLAAQPLSNLPTYKIKGFYDQAVLIERKRRVASLFGGDVLVVMRLNMLIDQCSDDIDLAISRLIDDERGKLEDRERASYDFSAENELLGELLDDYVRSPADKKALQYLTPLQTGYYGYSPEKHDAEKRAAHAAKVEKAKREAENRAYWLSQQ